MYNVSSFLLTASLLLLIVIPQPIRSHSIVYAPEKVGTLPGKQEIGAYQYDNNGNRTADTRNHIAIGVGLLNKPTAISDGADKDTFLYEPRGQRYLRMHANGRKTLYVGDGVFEYRLPRSGTVQPAVEIAFLYARGSGPIAQMNINDSKTPE